MFLQFKFTLQQLKPILKVLSQCPLNVISGTLMASRITCECRLDAADLGEEVIEDVSSQKRQAEGQRLAFLCVGENWGQREEVLNGKEHPESVVHIVTMG